MTCIAFLLLCHKEPEAVIAQAKRLVAGGDRVVIHFDGRSPRDQFEVLRAAVAGVEGVTLAPRRVKCGWGEWSLVEATLVAMREAHERFGEATHFYLISGDCMPIKSAAYAHDLLAPARKDYIESVDFYTSGWIKTGMREDRLIYRHYFNERTQPVWYHRSLDLQRKLKLSRSPPSDLKMMIGSQWWCLRRTTVTKLLSFIAARRDVVRFFRTTWIPDESFFQTLVRHLVADAEIENRTPTFLMFTDYGMPVNFYNDQYSLLLSQDFLFARKISPGAMDLKAQLGGLWASGQAEFDISDEGRQLHGYLTGRGRIGERFAPRFWERLTRFGPEREILILACRKRQVAKRLLAQMREALGVKGVAYLFHELDADLPDLGGIETSLDKRTRHRRAVVRMLFDQFETERLVICADTNALDVIRDFYHSDASVRLLDIRCTYSDAFLAEHARRVGLASSQSSAETMERVLPSLRQEVVAERDRLREANFANVFSIDDQDSATRNTAALAAFLGIAKTQARPLATRADLFSD